MVFTTRPTRNDHSDCEESCALQHINLTWVKQNGPQSAVSASILPAVEHLRIVFHQKRLTNNSRMELAISALGVYALISQVTDYDRTVVKVKGSSFREEKGEL